MILSYQDLDVIADSILREFKPGRVTLDAIDVERLARSFLGLHIRYERLSDDFSILGATTFSPVELELLCHGKTQVISLPANAVLLEERLLLDKKQQLGRRRFTLAHECAHQILHRYENADNPTPEVQKRTYSLRDLKSQEDWNEWQANALGAALLMPKAVIAGCMRKYACGRKLICYEHAFSYHDYWVMKNICEILEVSRSALEMRLRQLGYLLDKPYTEYQGTLEVWNDEEDV